MTVRSSWARRPTAPRKGDSDGPPERAFAPVRSIGGRNGWYYGTWLWRVRGALDKLAYSFHTRFENEPGTNPEELIAGAHAACYSMAFSATLEEKGYSPKRVETHATCVMSPKQGGGFEIIEMHLKVRGEVPGLDNETFVEIAHEALLREWPRLREWLDDDRDALRTHRHLTAASTAWAARSVARRRISVRSPAMRSGIV